MKGGLTEISLCRATIQTPDDWYGGATIRLVLERRDDGKLNSVPLSTCGIWARVVRRGFQGVYVEFRAHDENEAAGLRRFIASLVRRCSE